MCLTGATEAQGGGLEGRGESLAQAARVQSGCSWLMLFESSSSSSSSDVVLLVLLVNAEGVCVLGVLQERPGRWEQAFTLLAGEIGGLVRNWKTKTDQTELDVLINGCQFYLFFMRREQMIVNDRLVWKQAENTTSEYL